MLTVCTLRPALPVHSPLPRCHTSYVTNYDSQQEEECEENFRKVCQISYEPLAYNETVQICRTPIVKVRPTTI